MAVSSLSLISQCVGRQTGTENGVCSVIFTCTHVGAQGTARELASEELDHAGQLPSKKVIKLVGCV